MHKYAHNRLVVRKSGTNFAQSLDMPTLPFLYNFECTFVRMDTVNLRGKFEVCSFIPGYAHATFSPKWLMGICSDGPYEYTGQIWSP